MTEMARGLDGANSHCTNRATSFPDVALFDLPHQRTFSVSQIDVHQFSHKIMAVA